MFIFGGWFIPVNADPAQAPAPTQGGGTIELTLLTTGDVHADGGIPKGTSNLITGGVFVGSGVHAQSIVNQGPTTTYGPNDMVLDNWGKIDSWVAQAAVTSHGSSGIGFVNFGDIDTLKIQAPIQTHGMGARGFAMLISALAYLYARKHAHNRRFTFGTGKLGDLAAFASAVILALIALLIGWKASCAFTARYTSIFHRPYW